MRWLRRTTWRRSVRGRRAADGVARNRVRAACYLNPDERGRHGGGWIATRIRAICRNRADGVVGDNSRAAAIRGNSKSRAAVAGSRHGNRIRSRRAAEGVAGGRADVDRTALKYVNTDSSFIPLPSSLENYRALSQNINNAGSIELSRHYYFGVSSSKFQVSSLKYNLDLELGT